jgi:uncharacterized protein (DUF362 family)
MTNMLDALKSAQFVMDAEGQPVAIQLKPAVWEALIAWLQATGGGPVFVETSQESSDGSSTASTLDKSGSSALVKAAAILSEPSLERIWNNSEDDIYNDL